MYPYQAYIKQAGFWHLADDIVAPLMRSQTPQQPQQQQQDPSEQRLRGIRPIKMAADTDLVNDVTVAGGLGVGAIGATAGFRAGSATRDLSGRAVAHAMEPHPGTGSGRMLPKDVRMMNHAHNEFAAHARGRGAMAGAIAGAALGAAPGILMGAANKANDMTWLGY